MRIWAPASVALGVGDPEGYKPLRRPTARSPMAISPKCGAFSAASSPAESGGLLGLAPKFGALRSPLIRAGSDALMLPLMRRTPLRNAAAYVARLVAYAIIRELVRAAILSLIDGAGPS